MIRNASKYKATLPKGATRLALSNADHLAREEKRDLQEALEYANQLLQHNGLSWEDVEGIVTGGRQNWEDPGEEKLDICY